jgi:hypothetical protein
MKVGVASSASYRQNGDIGDLVKASRLSRKAQDRWGPCGTGLTGKPITCCLHRAWHRPRICWRGLPCVTSGALTPADDSGGARAGPVAGPGSDTRRCTGRAMGMLMRVSWQRWQTETSAVPSLGLGSGASGGPCVSSVAVVFASVPVVFPSVAGRPAPGAGCAGLPPVVFPSVPVVLPPTPVSTSGTTGVTSRLSGHEAAVGALTSRKGRTSSAQAPHSTRAAKGWMPPSCTS